MRTRGGHLFVLERPTESADLVANFLQAALHPVEGEVP
jgi:hypothetical protein